MFDWFAEGQMFGYVLAFVLASILGFFWFQKTRDQWLPLALLLLALGSVWLIDKMVVTSKEAMTKSIEGLRDGGLTQNWAQVKGLISEKFQHPSIGSRSDLEAYFQRWRSRLSDVRLVCWGFNTPPGTTDQVEFMFKAEGGGQMFFAKVLATMEKTDKGWKLKGFKLYNPVADLKELDIP